MPISQVYFELIPELNLIVDEYVGVLIIRTDGSQDPLIGDWKYSENNRETLQGILAFTQWKIDNFFRDSNNVRYCAPPPPPQTPITRPPSARPCRRCS